MKLRDYQQPVVDKASEILYDKGVCLMAAECRTGKSLMSMSVAEHIGAKSVLFVTPKKAILSVRRDYDLMRKANPFIFDLCVINPEAILAAYKKADNVAVDIIHCTYPNVSVSGIKFKALVEAEREKQLSVLLPFEKDAIDLIIVDECHRQGSFPKPCGSQLVLRMLARDRRVLLLSGTPNPESHSMFFHEFQISSRSPWYPYKNFYAWAKDYVNIEQKMVNGFHVADYSHGIKEKILNDIAPYSVTLTQEEAGFETNIDEQVICVRMMPETEQKMRRLRIDRVIEVEREDGGSIEVVADTPANMLNKLHQMSGGTIKENDEHIIFDPSKALYLLNNFFGHHFAIFYVYKAERDLLMRVFGSAITESPEEFQEDPSKIFIGQIRSCREGIRLDSAEFSVFYSMEFSYVSYKQGLMRIVSKERSNPSKVLFLTSQCKIEKMILNAVHNKESFTLEMYNRYR